MDKRDDTKTIQIDTPVEEWRLRRYSLRVVRGPDQGLERHFDRRVVVVGTSSECHFRLSDRTVSRVHARIEAEPSGYRIVDEGSKNGVFVNGVRVREGYLPQEADIWLGESRLHFRLRGDTVAIGVAREERFGPLIGRSVAMREVFALIKKVAPTDATVLIEGESGTGKELVARAIHQCSQRRDRPFVVFDCSAVPHDLLESELFGHVRGAFTGAVRSRKGVMEEASGGSLFLDEVGELPLDLQPKLLRAIETREVKPIGANTHIPVDVRIICATNRNLREAVEAGLFREDLYFRIAVMTIELPPLRRRTEDIPLLVEHFLEEICRACGRREVKIGWETMEKLKAYSWPGNVRELRNFLERAVIEAGPQETGPQTLELPELVGVARGLNYGASDMLGFSYDAPYKEAKEKLVTEFERRYFSRLLKATKGNISKAARLAGIHRKSLEYLLKRLEIDEKLED